MAIKQCARCLYTENHPLYLVIDDEGVCSGCRIHEEKDRIDWQARKQQLKILLEQYRCHSGNNYDCIIPVSGARDSYFIVDFIKNEMGMNPLLVSYNQQYNTDRGIRNLAYLRTHLDCDIFTMTVSPEKVKKITRATMRRFGSVYWHVLAGQTVFPVQTAVRLKIPLIIWGCHQGIDQVGMYSHDDRVEMTRKYRKEHDLMGYEAEDLLGDDDHIFEKDVYPYLYPQNDEIANVGVRGIYLNNYVRWDTKAQHERMIKKYGYESADLKRTFDYYNDVDSFIYSDLHDYTKLLKCGYTKVTDHACREIRFGRLSREEAKDRVKKHEKKSIKYQENFLDWIGMEPRGLAFILDRNRNPLIWQRDENWQWVRTDSYQETSTKEVDAARLTKKDSCEFILSGARRENYLEQDYILMAKGHVNNSSGA